MGRIGLGDLLRCFQAPTTCLFPRNSFPRIPGFSTTPHNIKTTTPSPSSCAVSSVHHIPAAATFYFFPSFCWHHLPYRLGMQEGLGQSTKSTIRSSEQSYMLVRAVRSCIAQQDVALHLGDTLPRKPSLLVARSHFLRAVGLERLAAALTGGHFSAAAHVNYCAAGVMYGKLCCAMETSVQRSGLDLQCRGEKKKKSCVSLIHICRVAVTVSSAVAEASPRLCLLRAPPRAGLAGFSAPASSARLRAGCPPWEQAACGYARVRTLAQKAVCLKKRTLSANYLILFWLS